MLAFNTYFITASNGAEIIDFTPEAEDRCETERSFIDRYNREKRWTEAKRKRKLSYKLRSACGLL